MNCEKSAKNIKRERLQQYLDLMRTTTREISTTEMSHSSVLEPFFAFSTGYTTTTLYHF